MSLLELLQSKKMGHLSHKKHETMADLSAAARAPALNQDNNAAAPEAADAAPAAGVAAAVDAAHNHQNGGGDGAVAPGSCSCREA